MMIICAILGLGGILYANYLFYWLRAEARRAGFPISVYSNNVNPWPVVNKMISAAQPDQKEKYMTLKRNMIVAGLAGVIGFVGCAIMATLK